MASFRLNLMAAWGKNASETWITAKTEKLSQWTENEKYKYL